MHSLLLHHGLDFPLVPAPSSQGLSADPDTFLDDDDSRSMPRDAPACKGTAAELADWMPKAGQNAGLP